MAEPIGAEEQSRLQRGLEQVGLELDDRAVRALLRHVELIRQWAGSYNLVSCGDLGALVERHVLDSLAVHPWLAGDRVLDVGSGAGFPGIPLAIARPDWGFALLDSSGKRTRFLRHVVRSLGLDNVDVIEQRVEKYTPSVAFNSIVSRAFSSLERYAQRVRHLAAPETRVVAIKGRLPSGELASLPGWAMVKAVEPYRVPGLHAERHVVIMSLSPPSA
jgi:16S rRNA (guanine527-N7)-methyltransferase